MSNSITASTVRDDANSRIQSSGDAAAAFAQRVLDIATKEVSMADFWVNTPWVDPAAASNAVSAAMQANMPTTGVDTSINVPAPTSPDLSAIAVPNFGNVPVLSMVAPVVNIPSAPSSSMPTTPGAAPTFDSPALPDAPTVTMPAPPVFQNLAIPTPPSYSIPTFTPKFPDDDILIPTENFSFAEQDYQDALLDDLKVKLMNDLLNGGYGIEVADEQALWERERERESLAAETLIQDATRQAAARGFAIPPGALNGIIESAQQSALAKISSVNRDIALKRADLYVENRKFTIQQVQQIEQMLITYYGYRMERALNVAKYIADYGIQIFNTYVQRFNARNQAAQVAASVYDTQLKAALAGLEAFKVEVEGAKLSVEAQKLYADVYRSQLEGVQAYVNIYRTQMEAANIQAQVEKLKIDAFRTTVDAYTAQVGARTAEFQMYEAQIKGEMAKVDVFKANVDAYGAQVSAYATESQALKTQLDAKISMQGLEIEKYKAELQGYGEALSKANITIQAQLGKYQADLRKFEVIVDAIEKAQGMGVQAQGMNAQVAVQAAQVSSSHITNTAQTLIAHDRLAADTAKGMFDTYSSQIKAASEQLSAVAVELQNT